MEQRRIVLIILIALLSSMLWHNWTLEHPKANPPTQVATQPAINSPDGVNTPTVTPTTAASANDATAAVNTPSAATAQIIEVKTDVLDIQINTQGGTITQSALPAYPLQQGQPAPVVLLNNNPTTRYLAQSTLVGQNFSDSQLNYTAAQTYYQLGKNQTQLVVNLTAETADGLKLVKSFTFTQGQYNIAVNYRIQNNSAASWTGNLYGMLSRTDNVEQTSGLFHVTSYTGASVSTQDTPYQKISFKNMAKQNLNTTSNGGWVAMQQHYFLSAWIPNQQQNNRYYTQVDNNTNLYTVGVSSPAITIAPGQTVNTSMQLYTGPELPDQLKILAPHLDLTIDYGWLWFISEAIFWLMQKIHSVVGNWGWSIVLVTVLIKLAFYHLSATSYRSMAKMRKLQPKLQALKERYGDDRQKLAQATMELYKSEKANPMSGCLPILVQIPVFIALYWVLIESVQLRQAPFIFWIHDLATRDPYYILPVLNGLAMFIQQKLNPPPPDPTQAKVMMFMPVLFTVLFMNFPAGLVLYWVVNSIISILQQWYIMRKVDMEGTKTPVKA